MIGQECCHRCEDERPKADFLDGFTRGMIVCPVCGNKRCPKATDHRHVCSGSNEPGQVGSIYR